MATTAFIPQIWNAEMLLAFTEAAIAANLVNRSYEGDARKGNKVTVTTGAAINIYDYSIGAANGGTAGSPKARTTAAEAVSNTSADLAIDQEKNFDFYVDDIDRRQAAGSMDAYTTSAGQGLATDSDKYILKTLNTAGTQIYKGDGATTPASITTQADAQNVIRDLRKALSKKSVPLQNRVLICNAEFEALLLDAAGKLVEVDTSGSPSALREGTLGRLYGFNIYTSENLPDVANAACIGFYTPSFSYVSQIEETEALRATDRFADRLRGLHVYGAKAFRPNGIATWSNKLT